MRICANVAFNTSEEIESVPVISVKQIDEYTHSKEYSLHSSTADQLALFDHIIFSGGYLDAYLQHGWDHVAKRFLYYGSHKDRYMNSSHNAGWRVLAHFKQLVDTPSGNVSNRMALWFKNAKPDNLRVYIKGNSATTWTGTYLGEVINGKHYKSVFDDRRLTITVHAINGLRYYGTIYLNRHDSTIVHIRAYKNQE